MDFYLVEKPCVDEFIFIFYESRLQIGQKDNIPFAYIQFSQNDLRFSLLVSDNKNSTNPHKSHCAVLWRRYCRRMDCEALNLIMPLALRIHTDTPQPQSKHNRLKSFHQVFSIQSRRAFISQIPEGKLYKSSDFFLELLYLNFPYLLMTTVSYSLWLKTKVHI